MGGYGPLLFTCPFYNLLLVYSKIGWCHHYHSHTHEVGTSPPPFTSPPPCNDASYAKNHLMPSSLMWFSSYRAHNSPSFMPMCSSPSSSVACGAHFLRWGCGPRRTVIWQLQLYHQWMFSQCILRPFSSCSNCIFLIDGWVPMRLDCPLWLRFSPAWCVAHRIDSLDLLIYTPFTSACCVIRASYLMSAWGVVSFAFIPGEKWLCRWQNKKNPTYSMQDIATLRGPTLGPVVWL